MQRPAASKQPHWPSGFSVDAPSDEPIDRKNAAILEWPRTRKKMSLTHLYLSHAGCSHLLAMQIESREVSHAHGAFSGVERTRSSRLRGQRQGALMPLLCEACEELERSGKERGDLDSDGQRDQ